MRAALAWCTSACSGSPPTARRLDGEDVFAPAHGESLPARRGDNFAVRFHLHPLVKASRHSDGHGVMLVLPEQGGMDVRRLRRTGRTGGKRLSRRPRRAAPLSPDRDLRARPRTCHACTGRSRTRTRRNRCGAQSRKSRSCRYNVLDDRSARIVRKGGRSSKHWRWSGEIANANRILVLWIPSPTRE